MHGVNVECRPFRLNVQAEISEYFRIIANVGQAAYYNE